ncbi:phosphoglycolate phosphatase [Desulfuromusa kysingii]|uniref:Phosphoglycolate phosphatase n=1 Tax=Desulfuromusa kysingii TaxID=37625 RepID=A0A1H4DQW3_9BACT|nr:HAD-IA family hydrolase [Desulfuromusa kysingii]SEA75131.1 phosphoglycolate phosphatase [Desulfuromusa kysingii]
MKTVIFDLDGTISDSSEGIFQSFNYALHKMNAATMLRTDVNRYIGPPLDESFRSLLETNDEDIVNAAVEFFRHDYTTVGYKINDLYAGIDNVLLQLAANGYRLFIATTKKTATACDVLRHFRLDHYFQGVYGGSSTIPKPELVRHILTEHHCLHDKSVMIGDTHYDIHAAQQNGIFSIGVAWGFGEEVEISTADVVTRFPGELIQHIENLMGSD